MFKPNLTDAQRDTVIQSLGGTTLVELVRASIRANDMDGLRAVHRNGGFSQTRLTANHLTTMADHLMRAPVAALDTQLLGMVDALGEVFNFRRPVNNIQMDASTMGSHLELAIPIELARFVADQVGECLAGIEADQRAGILPTPGDQGDGRQMRTHLAALACLAIAVDDDALLVKIKRQDADCLLSQLNGKHIQEPGINTGTIAPWGVAVVEKRLRLMQNHLDTTDINKPMATRQDRDGWMNIKADELMMLNLLQVPRDLEATFWIIGQFAKSKEQEFHFSTNGHSASHTSQRKRNVSERIVEHLCDPTAPCYPALAMQALNRVPEIFTKHLRTAIEACFASSLNTSIELLAKILRNGVDWSAWDDELLSESRARQGGMICAPIDHPLAIIIDAGGGNKTHDAALAAAMRVMADVGQAGFLLRTDLDFGLIEVINRLRDQNVRQPLAFEVAQLNFVNSLDVMISAGLDPAQELNGVSLIGSCESSWNEPFETIAMLRAAVARKEAQAAVESVLAQHGPRV